MAELRHFAQLARGLQTVWHRAIDRPPNQTGDSAMNTTTTIFHRSLAVLGSVAMTIVLMAGYFSAPAVTAVSGVIA